MAFLPGGLVRAYPGYGHPERCGLEPGADLHLAERGLGFRAVSEAAVNEPIEERLRRIEAVTDSALGYLDVEEFLSELLDRLLEVLAVDTAAVLLADDAGRELFARAARGLEEEVRQGVRVPIGRGFAGTVAASRRPLVLDRIDETTVANPILWQKGIRAMLGVPLLSGGSLIGVLHVGTLGTRRFVDHDIEVLQLAAERIASALHVRLLESER